MNELEVEGSILDSKLAEVYELVKDQIEVGSFNNVNFAVYYTKLYKSSRIIQNCIEMLPYFTAISLRGFNSLEPKYADKVGELTSYLQKRDFSRIFTDTRNLARIYGEAVIIPELSGNYNCAEPVSNKEIYSTLSGFKFRSCVYYQPLYYNSTFNIFNSPYVDSQSLYIDNRQQSTGIFTLHQDRGIRFSGVRLVDYPYIENGGYHDSILRAVLEDYFIYRKSITNSNSFLDLHSLFSLKMKGLSAKKTAQGESGISLRFNILLAGIKKLKAILLDYDKEEANFISRSYSGVAPLLEALKEPLASSSGLPASFIFNSPNTGAFSESGSSDRYLAAIQVGIDQQKITPEINQIIKLLTRTKDSPIYGLDPTLIQPVFTNPIPLTAKEQAEVYESYARGDSIYMSHSVLTDEEPRSRFIGNEFNYNVQLLEGNERVQVTNLMRIIAQATNIDIETIQALNAAELEQFLNYHMQNLEAKSKEENNKPAKVTNGDPRSKEQETDTTK